MSFIGTSRRFVCSWRDARSGGALRTDYLPPTLPFRESAPALRASRWSGASGRVERAESPYGAQKRGTFRWLPSHPCIAGLDNCLRPVSYL
jgi:hypothetical protein